MVQKNTSHPVILFDGDCNLCNSFVRFVMRMDTRGIFRFTSLQSANAQEILERFRSKPPDLSAVILLDSDKLASESDAVLSIARMLPGVWSVFYWLKIIPRPVRDALYRLIARHRYHIFGRCESCKIPDLRQSQ
jgi:predicted DCC family thiol-disulfide oxidoreductase YuxK